MDGIDYKMGWMIVAFDLPVVTKPQRTRARRFRDFLLDDGYLMLQFSVYARSTVTYARMQTHLKRLKEHLPPEGAVRAIFVTQSQWEKSLVIYGSPARKGEPEAMPSQLQLW